VSNRNILICAASLIKQQSLHGAMNPSTRRETAKVLMKQDKTTANDLLRKERYR
jgi:hypothetical protein